MHADGTSSGHEGEVQQLVDEGASLCGSAVFVSFLQSANTQTKHDDGNLKKLWFR